MILRQHFGHLMQQHRAHRTAVNVADAVGCTAHTIANLEDGHSLPPLPVYIRLCRHYGLTLAQRAELDEVAAGVGEVGR